MLRKWRSGYDLRAFLYMLQQVEYSARGFVKWWLRARSFAGIEKRARLKWTAKIGILAVLTGISALILLPITLLLAPILLPAILLFWNAVFGAGQSLIEIFIARKTRRILERHNAKKIIILGSYGKTTAKEVFGAVLGGAKNADRASNDDVKMTQGNENTRLGIARFARELSGDEKVLIFELGEFRFGDIRKLCEMIAPDYAIYTGVSGAHLDTLKSVDGVVKTLNEARKFVPKTHIAVNADNAVLRQQPAEWYFSDAGVNAEKITGLQVSAKGSRFRFLGVEVSSPLLGKHNIAIVAMAVYFAKKVLFYKNEKITEGLTGLRIFPHRMEPIWRGGSLVIDDTYNGNLEGVKAGIELLENLPFKHKVYVTAGLVEQGEETEKTHKKIGERLAKSDVEKVYLMQNSATKYIRAALKKSGFRGEVIMVKNPLEFYENMEAILVPEQVVLMQNDWGDGYA